ncbi:MAG TPA: MBL fold metallo-hydrolase [Frankiaceae bacterium]|jgi:L-ascorbate metabolism protein UlaG (beta-lactamase superfamily)|nr:MBL fold metallo-hydrolase [Frankiaceae bacterium]
MTDASRTLTLSKFRHSCLLVELGEVRILLDPGGFSAGFESLTELSAVLLTHQHPDHLDAGRLTTLLVSNPQAEVIADPASTAQLAELGVAARAVNAGDDLSVAGISIAVYGGRHAEIAPGFPTPPNVGYAIGGLFAYSGDAYTPPPEPVQVLAIPTAAPWLRADETVSYLQQVAPKAVVPVHDGMLATTDLYYNIYRRYATEQDIEFRVLDDGKRALF